VHPGRTQARTRAADAGAPAACCSGGATRASAAHTCGGRDGAAKRPVVPAQGARPGILGNADQRAVLKNFGNHRQVGAYVGLAPSPWQSGGTRREQGISKAGNPRARQAAIELAWLWIRHQPDSALTRWFRQRTANASSRIKRIAIVALARKLMVALWRYLTTGLVPEGAVLKPVEA
jgi:Transposase IS116/IS110/IS902 family